MMHRKFGTLLGFALALTIATGSASAFTGRSGASTTFTGQIGYDDANTRQVALNRAQMIRTAQLQGNKAITSLTTVNHFGDTHIGTSQANGVTTIGNQTTTTVDGNGNIIHLSTDQDTSDSTLNGRLNDGRNNGNASSHQ